MMMMMVKKKNMMMMMMWPWLMISGILHTHTQKFGFLKAEEMKKNQHCA
jgi:hypothetical protein